MAGAIASGVRGLLRRVVVLSIAVGAVALPAVAVQRAVARPAAPQQPRNIGAAITQCQNQTSGTGDCTGSAWITGNLNAQHALYREGDFVPFRAQITGLSAGSTYTLRIGYDAVASGLHAYDYLGSVDGSENAAGQLVVPCSNVAATAGSHACGQEPSTLAVPVDDHTTFPRGGQVPGSFSAWGALLTGAAYVSPTPIGASAAGTTERQIDVAFRADGGTVVLAWGGHIASNLNWGTGNTFVSNRSGAPFHMRVLPSASIQPGNQDLSLHGDVVAPLPSPFETSAAPQSVTAGDTVVDTATFAADVTGTVSFYVCFDAAATPDCASGGQAAGVTNVVAVGTTARAVSDDFVPVEAGHYCFRAEYRPSGTAPYSPGAHTNNSTECFAAKLAPTQGSLVVKKSISGEAAGEQGEAVISVDCGGVRQPNFVIAAGTEAGTVTSDAYGPFPAGTGCTVTETAANGHTTEINVDITGSPQDVQIKGTETKTVEIGDDYTWIPGSLVVRKTITGPAAAEQGEIRLAVTCGGKRLSDFVIPAEFEVGTHSHEHPYDNIPAGTTCTVSEVQDGSTSSVAVEISGDTTAVVPANDTATIKLTNTYTRVAPESGSLLVRKSITGPAAAERGPITIEVSCGEAQLEDFVIPTGATEPLERRYDDIPAGTSCTVNEVQDGSTSSVAVDVSGDREATVPAGGTGEIHLTDTYTVIPPATGSLLVSKSITGPAAAEHGPVTIEVTCGTAQLEDFVIPAGPGHPLERRYDGVPAGATCTVEEVEDGSTSSVEVDVSGDHSVTVPAGGTGKIHLTDTYTVIPATSGSLLVEKTITGPAAAQRGPVTIEVTCGTQRLDDFVIPVGPGQPTERRYDDVPAGTICTVAETQNGSTSTVDVVVSGDRSVTVPAGGTGEIDLTDTYTTLSQPPSPGELTVEKTITGPAAGEHGQIRLAVTCGEQQLEDFVIPAGASSDSRTYSGIPAGTTCTVEEISDGGTSTVHVVVTGDHQTIIPEAGTGSISLTDTYTTIPPATGSLLLTKKIGGPIAGRHGPIRIHVVCGTRRLHDFVIAAGAPTDDRRYDDIPVGTTCRVREVANGATRRVRVVVTGERTTVIPVDGEGEIVLDDYYYRAVRPRGSLVVRKSIVGASAEHAEIRIEVVCGIRRLEDFVIPAGAGSDSRRYDHIRAGRTCRVTEYEDGSTGSLDVEITGERTVEIPAHGIGEIHLTDTYTVVPPSFGSLIVSKTVAGPGAGRQGTITIGVTCAGKELPDFTIAAGAAAGTGSRRYDGIAAGSTCTVIETANGQTSTVDATVTGSGSTAVVPAGGIANLALTNTYAAATGSLVVNKTITGPAAGQQGPITIQVSCDGTPLPDFTIPAGAAAGTTSTTYTGLTAGATCALSEAADGQTATVTATVTGDRQATITAGGAATATLVDTYTGEPGTLTVEKTIGGEAAGLQAEVRIAVNCDGTPLPEFVIPEGQAAGTTSRRYTGIAAGTVCTLSEIFDGHTGTVDAAITGNGVGRTVTVAAGGAITVKFGDDYTKIPGALTVQDTITGPRAHRHARIRIRVSCNGRRLPDYVIPPNTGPATVSHTYHGLPADATCAVAETSPQRHQITTFRNGPRRTIPASRHTTVQMTTAVLAAHRPPAHLPPAHRPPAAPPFTG